MWIFCALFVSILQTLSDLFCTECGSSEFDISKKNDDSDPFDPLEDEFLLYGMLIEEENKENEEDDDNY